MDEKQENSIDNIEINVDDNKDGKNKMQTQSERIIHHNQSDIFSLNENIVPSTSIFSVNGIPSRRLYRSNHMTSTIFDNKIVPTIEKQQNVVKDVKNCEESPSNTSRNPLTGMGLSSIDEFQHIDGGKKRIKDGNPLLGSGYASEAKITNGQRIPPGGYSHKLW